MTSNTRARPAILRAANALIEATNACDDEQFTADSQTTAEVAGDLETIREALRAAGEVLIWFCAPVREKSGHWDAELDQAIEDLELVDHRLLGVVDRLRPVPVPEQWSPASDRPGRATAGLALVAARRSGQVSTAGHQPQTRSGGPPS
jgi:hypothetical protein